MSEFIKYFVYSRAQYKLRNEIEQKLGKSFVPGTIIVKGEQKLYTELTDSPNNIQFPDTEVIWAGDIRTVSYIEPVVE